MSLEEAFEQLQGFGSLRLRDLMGSSLEGDEQDSRVELFEARVLVVSEPGVAE